MSRIHGSFDSLQALMADPIDPANPLLFALRIVLYVIGAIIMSG